MDLITVYRPIGLMEYKELTKLNFSKWPPRQPEQKYFYPVTNEKYAVEIASRWNVKGSGAGYVTKFNINKSFMDKYDIHKGESEYHTEWWIPSEDVDELNNNLDGKIEIIREFF